MIFKIEKGFAERVTEEQLADLCCAMVQGRQYVDCSPEIQDLIIRAIDRHAGTLQKEWFRKFKGFDVTNELRRYLTTYLLDEHTSLAALEIILHKPSRLLVENAPYEWEVYKRIIGTYKSDRKFKNLFLLLEQAKSLKMLTCLHGGGYTTYPALLRQQDEDEYKGVCCNKICILFDRDTDDEHSFDSNKNALFQFLCGKKSEGVTDNDIYILSQSPYIWHMWYKRAIENYFPGTQYSAQGIDTSRFPASACEHDYFKIEGASASGYDKNKLPKLAEKMSRADYEANLKRFDVEGDDLSEMQLFLLKLVKII